MPAWQKKMPQMESAPYRALRRLEVHYIAAHIKNAAPMASWPQPNALMKVRLKMTAAVPI